MNGLSFYTTLLKRKNDKKESDDPMRAWQKCKGAAQAELCTTLAFFWWASKQWSPHTLAAFCVVLLQRS